MENVKNRMQLHLTTDSLVYSIQHHDIYEWIKNNEKHFDLSDSLRHDMKNNDNKKVVGKFKDELNSLVMKDFIALNPKVYSFNHQTMKDKHEKIMKDKLINIEVEKEIHKFIMLLARMEIMQKNIN